jgi:hypothetical protein
MAVAFCEEAKEQLRGRCDTSFDTAAHHYRAVCDALGRALALHPERRNPDWGPESTFASEEAAAIICEAAEADVQGLATLQQIVETS